MEVVSVSKFARAERDLRNGRPMSEGPKYFYRQIVGMVPPMEIDSQLIVSLTSDNGSCGTIRSGIAGVIRGSVTDDPSLASKTKLMCVGEYSVSILSRTFAEDLIRTAKGIRKKPITFLDTAIIAMKISDCITRVYYGMSYEPDFVDLKLIISGSKAIGERSTYVERIAQKR